MSDLNYVGKSLVREDAVPKVTGETKYIVDMERPNMLYARLLLSQKAHAKYNIDTTKALQVEGIVGIYTFEDVPKVQYNSHEWYPGVCCEKDEYLLNPEAHHYGDRIGLVVGETMACVEKALSQIQVTYEELPVIATLEEAIKQNNIAFEASISCGDTTPADTDGEIIIEDTGTTQKIHHAAMEPHSCLAEYDDFGNLVVWTPCQVVTQVQNHIATVLGLPFHKVRVIKAVMGGSFGGKGQTVLEPICAFATMKTKRPVKLLTSREEAILATRSRNATKMHVKTTVTKEGNILARELTTAIDGGAYYTNASAVTMAIGKKAFRLYHIPNQTFTGKAYYTHTVVGGACRGYGSPQLHAITEINIDHVAHQLGMDPCLFRLQNLVNPYDKDPTGGTDLGNGQIKQCVIEGMNAFEWSKRYKCVQEKNTHRYAYGVGMACAVHGNGYKGAYPDFLGVRMFVNYDGTIELKLNAHEQGCGTIVTLKQIACEVLNIPLEQVILFEADTFVTPYDSAGTQASRVTFVMGGAVKKASETLRERILSFGARYFKVEPSAITFENGRLQNNQGASISLGDLCVYVEKECKERIQIDVHYESPANPSSYAACFVEVRVDRWTGHVKVVDCLAVHDIGKQINPVQVEGQIQGGAHFSIGMALREEILTNEKGIVESLNFSKYHLLNAVEMPEVKVLTIEGEEPFGPFGAKSVGELSAVAPAPAVVNAINFALGTHFCDYPVTPEKIVVALNEGKE